MDLTLRNPDMFKVRRVIEDRNNVPNRMPDPLVRYFYPEPDLVEFTSLSKGYNAFTEECDKYRVSNYVPKDPYYEKLTRTYLYMGGVIEVVDNEQVRAKYGKNVGRVVFRLPGATRGSLTIDMESHTILNVIFEPSTCFNANYGCYTKDVMSLVDKYKGTEYVVDYVDGLMNTGEAL